MEQGGRGGGLTLSREGTGRQPYRETGTSSASGAATFGNKTSGPEANLVTQA